jgi:hypothetical protein
MAPIKPSWTITRWLFCSGLLVTLPCGQPAELMRTLNPLPSVDVRFLLAHGYLRYFDLASAEELTKQDFDIYTEFPRVAVVRGAWKDSTEITKLC